MAVWAFGGWRWDLRPWGCQPSDSYRAVVDATPSQPLYLPPGRIVPLDVERCPGRRRGGLEAVDAGGRALASARFDGAEESDRVELSLVLGPSRPPTELVGELVRATAALAAGAGAGRLVVDFDPACRLAQDVVAASGLDWRVRATRDGAVAELSLDESVPPVPTPPHNASVVRTHPRGVTVMPSAEGPSLRSDPRWTPGQARRTDRLLGRLVAQRRSAAAGWRRSMRPHRSQP